MALTPLSELLSARVGEAFASQGFPAERGRVVSSARPDLGQFQCNGAMAVAKEAKKNPMEIAEALAVKLKEDTATYSRVEVAKPGFLNIDLTDAFLSAHANAMAADAALGGYVAPEKQTVMIDYCGPNIAKPMHVGHLRSSVIGNSLYRLFKRIGHTVIGDIHLGDWGLQMGMLISEYEARVGVAGFDKLIAEGIKLTELETLYPQVAAACKETPERMEKARAATEGLQNGNEAYRKLWRHFVDVSLSGVKANLQQLDVDFDLWKGESDVQGLIPAMVDDLKKRGVATLSEGAWIIEVEQPTDKSPMPPMLLIKSDGAALYSTTDLATILERRDTYNPDIVLYVVDQRQHLHFEQVFRAAKISGLAGKAKLEHIGYGTVNGKDGKPFKTREGGVMKLSDLIEMCVTAAKDAAKGETTPELVEQIGIAALKFADLGSQIVAGYVFDVEKFVSVEGRTGPYLQYACVRVQSILAKSDIAPGPLKLVAQEERELALACARFPNALKEAVDEREPSVIADYAYTLAQAFSRFYAACPIAKAEDPAVAASRITLAKLTHGQIAACLDVLGIKVPERM